MSEDNATDGLGESEIPDALSCDISHGPPRPAAMKMLDESQFQTRYYRGIVHEQTEELVKIQLISLDPDEEPDPQDPGDVVYTYDYDDLE